MAGQRVPVSEGLLWELSVLPSACYRNPESSKLPILILYSKKDNSAGKIDKDSLPC